ncbi:ABC transporter substrate-binding protein [Mahella australiensis]|uniref:Extracellular solute-binding protein family 1 n=1 Tax=Mahella australiensis (strain DSM 15567 / CIP 107919 / 50-1 BON) TaxID=697281 RepID=F3ZWH4_MAHA5|nr:ABC transporter substrate-binding protein [Mahella australiensis]AEE95409.1 extracellular solute-binding protein family 1 [Mahella australiensis 50-1 BON]
MRKLRVSLVFLLAISMFVLQVGCTPTKTQSDNMPSESGTSETDGSDASSEKQTITFWKWIPTEGSQTDDLVAAWEKEYPNIKLDITHVGESEAHFQKLSAALAANEGPSVLALQVGARANQFKDFCEPLRPLAEKKWGSDWENKFLPAALEQCRYSGDDYTVLPGGMTATPVIMYNAAAFEKLGITKAPETMQDVYDAIEKSKRDPNIIPGVAIGAKEGWACRDVFMGIINQIAPGKVYEAADGKSSFTEPEFVEALEIWKNLFDSGFFAEGSLGTALYPDINDNFSLAGTDGRRYYIMMSCGTWHGSGLTKKAVQEGIEKGVRAPEDKLTMGAFTLPAVKEDAQKNMVVTVDVAWGVNNSKPQKEKEAAFEFVAWMAAGHGQEIWSNSLQVLPCAKGVSLEPAMNDMRGEPEKKALEMFQYYVENNAGAREIKYAEISNALNDVLPAVAAGAMTPEEATKQLQAASESVAR